MHACNDPLLLLMTGVNREDPRAAAARAAVCTITRGAESRHARPPSSQPIPSSPAFVMSELTSFEAVLRAGSD